MADVTDNTAESRYELNVDGKIVVANYRRSGNTVAIQHVEAPPELRGTGAASRLMDGIVETARAQGLKLLPRCSYAVWWMGRHKEHADLLA